MTTHRTARTVGGIMGAGAVALAACQLEQLDALRPPPAEAGAASPGVDGSSLDDAPTDSGVDGIEVVPTQACTAAMPPLLSSTFDTTDDAWILSSSGADVTMSWYGGLGDPSPGSLKVDDTGVAADASGPAVVWVHEEMAATDLTGRTVSAWVWLDSGPSPQFLSFVQTEASYAWGDTGEISLPPSTWTCVSLSVSSPASSQSDYDPTHVIRIGFEMIATAPFRLLIDSVRAK